MKLTQNQDGFFIIKIILIIATMILGYILISNALSSDEGQEAVDTVNSAREKADQVLQN